MSSSWRAGAGEAWASMQSTEPGTRRRKLAGYLKAANEMRQNYQDYYIGTRSSANSDYENSADEGMPGAFPEAGIVRSGKEEMVLFPTYAMRHIKRAPEPPREGDETDGVDSGNEAEYWTQEWSRIEEDRAVVDVDVRGWIYTPHTGPMTRKNRILMGLARRLSGIPAPPSQPEAQSSIPMRSRHEQEAVEREAENIMFIGEEEANAAAEGRYTEDSTSSPVSRSSSRDSRWSTENMPSFIQRRSALWTQQPPPNMTPEELAAANTNLIGRLKAFMAMPAAQVPVTVFFYNEDSSQSRTTYTNDSGHFYVRAALEFVPTHSRVLASEGLATVQEVKVVDTAGVSLISDIDDTIKHSAISSGAREIFRNTFVAEFDSMVVEGVKDWYGRLNELGVQIHYVSNSPWQLYPFLRSYFKAAGLPHGSFHLKQYSGMLQGIFEPVAERKKGTLTRIMSDFPDRKFILVGDSGEADLEVYTDVVLANPGRILGVFIRDVTSPVEDAFFTKSVKDDGGSGGGGKEENSTSAPKKTNGSEADQNLIDLSDPVESPAENSLRKTLSRSPPPPPAPRRIDSSSSSSPNAKPRPPPVKPNKPSGLRGEPTNANDGRPPIPPKPRPQTRVSEEHASGVLPNIKNAASSVYNSLPAASSLLPSAVTSSGGKTKDDESRRGSAPPTTGNVPFPPPPRRAGPAKATTWTPSASDPTTEARHENISRSASPARQPVQANTAAYKRLEMWKRRWEKAEQVMRDHGVVLVMWRVGTDVMRGSEALVEKALREIEEQRKENDRGKSGKNKHKFGHHGSESLI